MDKFINEVEEFKKQEDKVENKSEKTNKEAKIVFNSDEKGNVKVLELSGQESLLLAGICVILRTMEKQSDNSAERMATHILTALEMGKQLND